MNKRNSIVDLEKFIAALVIMSFHKGATGATFEIYKFGDGWIFVEFFLIITGYYTAKHFQNILGILGGEPFRDHLWRFGLARTIVSDEY